MLVCKLDFIWQCYELGSALGSAQVPPPPPTPGCIPCKLYAGDMPTLTIDSIVICQTHAGYLRTFVHRMHPGPPPSG